LIGILGLEITPNGILMTTDYQGRNTGESFVQFGNKGHAEQALEKNKQSIGHRWAGKKERKKEQ
jgi:heterogeneous nuclear ribonucleoprotein F/H